ncbi:MAG TPA: ABC transporter permease [Kiritimatiellia bacterium]|nr:ABC transporter permease [Kiritimatiellia bacterium]HRZ11757.1 ABC transporter permease [Kiritimatiellia bacterium]HSA17436.1 ABC transporter permease [Kiritimatiellia bacterium]
MLDFHDLLRVSFRQVRRQRSRYLGVLLTVTLGTSGFIAVNTIGRNVKSNLDRDLDVLGGVTIVKVFFDDEAAGRPPTKFRPATLDALRAIPGVEGISAMAMKMVNARVVLRGERYGFTLVGVDEHFWSVNRFAAVEGRLFSAGEIDSRRTVCVLGAGLARQLYGTGPAVGQDLLVDGDLYRVTGLLDGPGVGDRDQWAFIPVTTAQDRIHPLIPPNRLYVRCRSVEAVRSVTAAIPDAIARVQPADHLRVEVGWERLKHVQRMVWWVQAFVHIAVAATLALGGFGIWTIMMSAARSRTREIGLKKAMGAEDRDILAQFLAESATLSLAAGLLGTALGWLAVRGIGAWLGSRPPPETLWLYMGVSLFVAFALGVGAGFYPSFHASRMEPVTAIKYE